MSTNNEIQKLNKKISRLVCWIIFWGNSSSLFYCCSRTFSVTGTPWVQCASRLAWRTFLMLDKWRSVLILQDFSYSGTHRASFKFSLRKIRCFFYLSVWNWIPLYQELLQKKSLILLDMKPMWTVAARRHPHTQRPRIQQNFFGQNLGSLKIILKTTKIFNNHFQNSNELQTRHHVQECFKTYGYTKKLYVIKICDVYLEIRG